MIRNANIGDLHRALEIYDLGRAYMRKNGNMSQWTGSYPDSETLRSDIAAGNLYVMEEDGSVFAVFALMGGEDPTYLEIDGAWKSDTPYGAIHRIASDGTHRGVFAACAAFARERFDHLRVDTHADNIPMQNAVLRDGFTYQGVIHLADGAPRNAYEWTKA